MTAIAIAPARHATTAPPAVDACRGLPPSARAIAAALATGPRTSASLADATGLPDRTVRYAVARLRDAGLVRVRGTLHDGRKSWVILA